MECLHFEHRPRLSVQRHLPIGGTHNRYFGELLAAGSADDADRVRGNLRRQKCRVDDRISKLVGVDQEIDMQHRLVGGVDDLHKVDPRDTLDSLIEQCG